MGLIGDDSDLRHALEAIESVFSELREERSFIHFCWATASYPREAQSAAELLRLAEHRLSIEQRRIRHEEEERQRHLEKLSAIGQLAAGLAHEIRNPLTSIRGFIQISMMESEEMKKWESIILPEIDRINDLLKQFLDLSDTRPSQFVRFELDGLIADVLRLLEPKAILDGHQLTAEPPLPGGGGRGSGKVEAGADQFDQERPGVPRGKGTGVDSVERAARPDSYPRAG